MPTFADGTVRGNRVTLAAGVLAALGLVGTGCASATRATDRASFVVVRHAEKATDDVRDPSLSNAGRERAADLAARFDSGLDAAYATQFKRTQQTAQPAAARHGIAVTTYDADTPAAEFAARLRRAHPRGTVLVVGHSNTVPGIVAALCACAVPPMRDDEFGTLYRVEPGADGARLQREDY